MFNRPIYLFAAVALSLVVSPTWNSIAQGQIPFKLPSSLTFSKVKADPSNRYELTDANGPWLIMAASFVGDSGEQQAHDLVLELRRDHKLPAYVYHKRFDYSESIQGKGWVLDKNKELALQRMKNLNTDSFEEIAVVVGDFDEVDSKAAKKALEKIKLIWPKTLQVSETIRTSQRMAVIREMQRRIHPDEVRKKQGQMSGAFMTPNPLMPEEYFNPNGPDKFVLDLNRGVEFSLLNCPSAYTVRVATFGGDSSMNLSKEEEQKKRSHLDRILGRGLESKLSIAANNAHTLTVSLRKKGVEAYEFHDRTQSVVCIGHYDWVSHRNARTGQEEPNGEIYKVIQQYGAVRSSLPGLEGRIRSKSLKEHPKLMFDITPLPIEVPKYSVANAFSYNK